MPTNHATESGNSNRRIPALLAWVVFAALVVVTYYGQVNLPWQAKDLSILGAARTADMLQFISPNGMSGWWQPITAVTVKVESAFADSPIGGRWMMLLILSIVAVLLYSYTRKIMQSEAAGWVAGFLFVFWPGLLESRLALNERGQWFAAMFMLAALLTWTYQSQKKINGKILSIILAGLAMLSHPAAGLWVVALTATEGDYSAAVNRRPYSALVSLWPAWLLTLLIILFHIAFWPIKFQKAEFSFINVIGFAPDAGTLPRLALAVIFVGILGGAISLGSEIYSKALRFGVVIAALCWLTVLFFPNPPTVFLALTFFLLLANAARTLWEWPKSPMVGRIVLFAVFLFWLVAAFIQTRKQELEWRANARDLTEIDAAFHDVLTNTETRKLVLYGVGGGRQSSLAQLLVSQASIQKPGIEIKFAGEWNAANYLDIALNDEEGVESWLYFPENEKFRRLESEETRPHEFRLSFTECYGEITFDSMIIQETKRPVQRVNDLRLWRKLGGVIVEGQNHLKITGPRAQLYAPPNASPDFKRLDALRLNMQYLGNKPNCTIAVQVDDRKGQGYLAVRSITHKLTGKLDWRISGYEPGVRAWYRHVSAIEMVSDLEAWPNPKLDFLGTRKLKGVRTAFPTIEPIERVKVVANYEAGGADAQREGFLMWLTPGQEDWRPDQARPLRFINDEKTYIFGMTDTISPVTQLAVLWPSEKSEVSLLRIEILRSVAVPTIEME